MISIVIPVYNEEEALFELYKRLELMIRGTSKDYEIIFIDDGSKDTSFDILKQLEQKDKHIRVISFRKNQGKAEALTVGFQLAKGDYIVTMDADLQDMPEEIPNLLSKAKEGYDVVSGWRRDRKDAKKMVFASKLFNRLAYLFWKVNLHDYNCGLKIYTKDAAKSLRLYGGMHRFIPLLCFENGFNVAEIVVQHEQRKFGKSKYGFSKMWKDLPDMFTILFLMRYKKQPLHFFGTIGMLLVTIGVGILIYLWGVQLQGHSIGRRPLLFVGFFSLISGLQIFFTGFLADLLIHTSEQTKIYDHNDPRIKYISK